MTDKVSLPSFRHWMFGLLALGLALVAAPHMSRAQEAEGPDVSSAKAFISDLADRTINLLSADMTSEQKSAQFSTLLEEGVNTDYVSRFVLGRNWNTASAQQRDDFRRLFKEFLLANLTERLSGEYDNQSFTVKNAVPAGSKDVLVRSEIQRTSGPPLKVEWRVRQFGDKWQIIDIAAEGLSLAITQREEYGSVVQRKGMDGLLAALNEQVSQIKAGNPDAELPDAGNTGS
jgi:phospholipid transport system substrate-binding protein